jgi:hypothetical protein
MSGTLIALVIQIIAGIVGGHAAGQMKTFDLGTLVTPSQARSVARAVDSCSGYWLPLSRARPEAGSISARSSVNWSAAEQAVRSSRPSSAL